MYFSELVSAVAFVRRPHRLLRDDRRLTETQRLFHPRSEQNVTFVACQNFKNLRLVRGSP